jgi:transcriptional regulator with XRE-family HTH domain
MNIFYKTRLSIKLNQGKFATYFGVSGSRMSRIERDKRRPTLEMVNTLCRIFGVNKKEVFLYYERYGGEYYANRKQPYNNKDLRCTMQELVGKTNKKNKRRGKRARKCI